jgi:hypothetical protein
MTDLEEFIVIFRNEIARITTDTDTCFTRFNTPQELKESLTAELNELQNGNLNKILSIYRHFAPTSTFQELSIQNGWAIEYMDIAGRIDELYKRIKSIEKK